MCKAGGADKSRKGGKGNGGGTGQETIGWKAVETLEHQAQAYQKEGDCALYSDRPTLFATLQPGEFAIVYPEDPHAPVIGEGKIRKLIGKVKL